MNLQEKRKYWESLGVSFRRYNELWESKYRNTLKRQIDKAKLIEIQYITSLFELQERSELENFIEDIEKGLPILCAFEFCKGKNKFIKENCTNFDDIFEITEKENPKLAVLKLYKNSPESLKNVFIYYYWRLTKTAQVFSPDVNIDKDHINKLKTKMNNITRYLSNHNFKKYSFVPFGILEKEAIFIFQIDRQTGDKIKRNIKGVIRDKSVSEIFLEFDIEKQKLKIKSKGKLSESITNDLITSIENVIKFKLFMHSEIIEEESYSYDRFQESLRNPNQVTENEIKVINLTLNKTKLPYGIPLELSRKSKGIDIKASINQLIENDFINLSDILYINYLYIDYENKQRKITVKELEESGEIILKLDDSSFSEGETNIIKEKFLDQFGLPVDIPINPTEITKNFDKRAEYLLNSNLRLDPPRPIQIEDLRILKEKRLIRLQKLQRVKCLECGFGGIENIETKYCTECEGELKKIDEVIQVNPDKNGIKKYLIQLLINEGLEISNKNAVRTFSGKKINLIEIRYKERKIFLYISYEGVNKKLLQYLQRASTPLFVIHMSHSFCRDLIDEKLFSQVRLSELVNLEIEGFLNNFFSLKLDEQLTYCSAQINRSAIESAKNVELFLDEKKDYSYNDLEDDTFSILKDIFRNSEKWGKEFIGIAAPEGISGFTFSDNDRTFNVSFSWDCKFTENDYYEINNINEVRKARDYIKKAIHSPSLKSFSKKLNAYFIVTNSIKLEDFEKYSEKVLRIREAKPTINLMDLDALFELHRLYNVHYEELKTHNNTFLKHFFNTIVRKTKNASFNYLDRQVIIKIFEDTLNSPIEVERLDTNGVRKSMAEDII